MEQIQAVDLGGTESATAPPATTTSPPSAASSPSTTQSSNSVGNSPAPETKPSTARSSSAPLRRRGYRACLTCKAKKLKCDLGDVDAPSSGPCKRCLRERRECTFEAGPKRKAQRATFPPLPLPLPPSFSQAPPASMLTVPPPSHPTMYLPSRPSTLHYSYNASGDPMYSIPLPPVDPPPIESKQQKQQHLQAVTSEQQNGRVPGSSSNFDGDDSEERDEEDEYASSSTSTDNALLSSSLRNPNDALRMLAKASALRSRERATLSSAGPSPPRSNGLSNSFTGPRNVRWEDFEPINAGMLSKPEAEVLLQFFQQDMAPLYPLLCPQVFSPEHFPVLLTTEQLLLGTILAISARYSPSISPIRSNSIHRSVASWCRNEIASFMDGTAALRHISTVEALLLFAEFPALPVTHKSQQSAGNADSNDMQALLKVAKQYDAHSWTIIGCAVRLAQELNLDEQSRRQIVEDDGNGVSEGWRVERVLQTWLFAYSADRHISVRLGRNALVQSYLPTNWWQSSSAHASRRIQDRGGLWSIWSEPGFSDGIVAGMLSTIHERLYPSPDVTRVIINSGQWEGFLRSLSLEQEYVHKAAANVLNGDGLQSCLLHIEFDYVQLYGCAIALRSWQERHRKRIRHNDFVFRDAPLFSHAEYLWIERALRAAQAILQRTVDFLYPKMYLRRSPARIFLRVLFCATFILKALASGVVENKEDQAQMLTLLESAIAVLSSSKLDDEHLSAPFSSLLRQLQTHTIAVAPVLPDSSVVTGGNASWAAGGVGVSSAAAASATGRSYSAEGGTPAFAHWDPIAVDESPFDAMNLELKFPWETEYMSSSLTGL